MGIDGPTPPPWPGCMAACAAIGNREVARATICPQTCSAPGTDPAWTICLHAALIASTADFTGMIPDSIEARGDAVDASPPAPGEAAVDRSGRGGSGAAAALGAGIGPGLKAAILLTGRGHLLAKGFVLLPHLRREACHLLAESGLATLAFALTSES